MALAGIEPFGDDAADLRHGIATAVLANVNRDPKRTPEPFKATDFIDWHPINRAPQKVDDPETLSRKIKRKLFKWQG